MGISLTGKRAGFILLALCGAIALLALCGLIGTAQAQETPGVDIPSAQDLMPDMGEEGEGGALSPRIIQLFLLVTVLSLAPGLAMMITCLPFMVIVFSFLRQALGLQAAPPNMMIMALAMFLTFFVMEPTFKQAWDTGLEPYMNGAMEENQAFDNAMEPFQAFMQARVEPETMGRLAGALPNRDFENMEEPPLSLLVPSFMLSEIKRAFQIGFVIFLPFLIIDLIVASILMAMGMMMVPPAIVSLPFKLAFFVMADGWVKITEALLRGYTG